MHCSNLILAASALLSTATCAAVMPRADSSFSLYAYGQGIGGAELFYLDGAAHVGVIDNVPSNVSAYNVTFTRDDDVRTITAESPTNSSVAFTNDTFYVPAADNSSTGVGFLSNTTDAPSDIVTSGWMFYGHVVILETAAGTWETLFYAKTTDYDSVWSLHWNVTDDDTAVPLAVKNSAPSN